MRRIVIALMSTVSGVVLLLAYPTSTHREVATADPDAATPDQTAAGTAGTAATEDATATGPAASPTTAEPTPTTTDDAADGTTTQGVSGTFTGAAASTRYGDVQVQIVVVDGVITDAEAIAYPDRDPHDARINAQAVPVLEAETVDAQSAAIDLVSGATFTSRGYVDSLQDAIDQAFGA